jgi:ABC-2 type transport system permease protein
MDMLKIFLKMKEQYIKTEMEYPVNFWMMLISGVLTKVLSMAIPFVIYSNIPDIAGWKRDEIYLIMAFLFIAQGLCSILFNGIWEIPEMVFNGQFDCILSRPISALFQVLSYGMGLQGISEFAVGLVCLPILLSKLNMLNVQSVVLSVVFVVCGTVLCMSVYLIWNSIVFWYDSGGRTTIPYVAANIGQYAKYPIEIYPWAIRMILLFVIPYAFICVVPVQILKGEHVMAYLLSIVVVSAAFFAIARAVFYRGIRHYESMGM